MLEDHTKLAAAFSSRQRNERKASKIVARLSKIVALIWIVNGFMLHVFQVGLLPAGEGGILGTFEPLDYQPDYIQLQFC